MHATARLFQALKAPHGEPDPAAAAAVGIEHSETDAEGNEVTANPAGVEVLRTLPGVNDKNYKYVGCCFWWGWLPRMTWCCRAV